MNKYEPCRGRAKRGYCSRKRYEQKYNKKLGSIAPHALMKTGNFITVVGLPGIIHR